MFTFTKGPPKRKLIRLEEQANDERFLTIMYICFVPFKFGEKIEDTTTIYKQ